MNIGRRSLLSGAAAVIGGGALYASSRLWRGGVASDPQPLQIPPLLDARSSGQSISLTARAGQTQFFAGRPSPTQGYNGSYLGPTLRLHRGDDVQMAVTNALSSDTSVHWHGLLIPAEVDGSPHQPIRPGETWRPVLAVRQPAATLFYHPHLHGQTATQVYSGLAGVLLVVDESQRGLGLPDEYGVDDLPLVLQDREFNAGRMVLPAGMMTSMLGRRGDTLLVNGTPHAVARVPARLVRLRLVNGSNARIYDLSFDDGRVLHWIATEGGLLDAPVQLRSLSLAPGQRAEVLVDFSDGRKTTLMTAPDANASMGGMMGARGGGSAAPAGGPAPVLVFEPGLALAVEARKPVAPQLVTHERVDASRAVKRRRFTLDMGMGGMGGGGGTGGMGGMGGMGGLSINGRAFQMGRIDERVRLGDVEIWEVSAQMMAHPFHVHGVHFEVLRRGGGPAAVRDQGLRDTVLVKDPVELLVRFTQPARIAPFMYHCHILEHEDGGMMGQFATD